MYVFLLQVLMLYQMYEARLIKSLDDPLSVYNSNFSIRNPYSKWEHSLDVCTCRCMCLRMYAKSATVLKQYIPCMHHMPSWIQGRDHYQTNGITNVWAAKRSAMWQSERYCEPLSPELISDLGSSELPELDSATMDKAILQVSWLTGSLQATSFCKGIVR